MGGKSEYYLKFKQQNLIPQSIDKYFEPFCGGCGFALKLYNNNVVLAKDIYLNDLSTEIYEIYDFIKDEENLNYLVSNIVKYERNELTFNELKKKYNDKINPLPETDRIVVLVYLLSYAFGGKGCNQNGFTGTFRDKTRSPEKLIHTDKWKQNAFKFSMFLQEAHMYNKDYSTFLEQCEEGDWVFLDPPYLNNVQYFEGAVFDFQALFYVLEGLTRKKVKFLLILGDVPAIRKIFSKFRFVEFEKVNHYFGKVKEVAYHNYDSDGKIFDELEVKEVIDEDQVLKQRMDKLFGVNEIPNTVDLELQMAQLTVKKRSDLKKYLKFRTYWIVISAVLIATEVYNLINFMINWTRIGNDLWHNQPEWAIGTAILLLISCVSVITVFYYQNKIFIIRN